MSESLIVACPACNTLNRVPQARLAAAASGQAAARPLSTGKCGQCGAALFQGHPVALDATGFESHAVKSDLPLLVDFWAPWCGPCRAMAPQFERAAARLEPAVRLAKVNTDEQQELAGRFGIQGIPTMILFRRGREVARQSGATDSGRIEGWVRQALAG